MSFKEKCCAVGVSVSIGLMLSACGGDASKTTEVKPSLNVARPISSLVSPAPTAIAIAGARKDFVISKNENQFWVTPRTAVGSAQSVPKTATLQFTDIKVNLAIGAKANLISPTQLDSLIELYVAFFNRIPESDGLAYWIDDFVNGSPLDRIADNFYYAAQQYPLQTGYSASMTTAEFVKIIYKNVLGRTGDTAPTDAEVKYWGDQINDGRMTRGRAVLVMLQAAHEYVSDPKWSWMVNLLNNKIAVSKTFAVSQGFSFNTPEENISRTIDIASRITPTSNEAALNQIAISDKYLDIAGRSTPKDLNGICTPEGTKIWARTHLDDIYLWYRDIVDTNRQSYENSNDYFSSLLVRSRDRFSFTQTASDSTSYFEEGAEIGYGARWVWSNNQLRVRYVHTGSPADLAGIKRGDTLSAMDGVTINGSLTDAQYYGLYYPKAGESHQFQIVSSATQLLSLKPMTAMRFALTPVLQRQIIASGGKRVGYLVFTDHISTAEAPLIEAVSYFKASGIDELVLDLRYNGGGYLYIANFLASMIGGTKVNGKIFERLLFNDKYPEYTQENVGYFYTGDTNNNLLPKLNLTRVFVITSGSTCSASESIINSLTPFVSVIRIGQNTCGKPYGMIGKTNCGVAHYGLQFSSVNSVGFGDFVSGFAPHCVASEDLNHALGDTAENRLATSLRYIQTGSCGTTSVAPAPALLNQQEREIDAYPWRSNGILKSRGNS